MPIKMAFWGGVESFAILLSMTIMIEILKQRLLYIVLLAGIVGFFFAGIIGTVVGLAIGMVFFLTYRFKLHEKNVLARFWSYLWKKTIIRSLRKLMQAFLRLSMEVSYKASFSDWLL